MKVLDVNLPFARTGRIWPYYGDTGHPVILYDYTATRERAGPEEFLKGYRGYLQADAYGGYDACAVSILMAANLVSMRARSRGTIKGSFSPELVAMPEVSGGQDTGDGF